MKCTLTLQEKLQDLRKKNQWKLAEVEQMTGIPTSTLQRLESDDCPQRINHEDIRVLAKVYNVSTDFLFGVTDNLQHRNIEVDKLRLSDVAIDVLSSGKINNRLISEFISHPDFPCLLSAMEIYIDRKISPQVGTMNGIYKLAENTIREKFKVAENDEILGTLQEAIVNEDEFLRYRITERFNDVIKSLFDAHKNDALSKENESVLQEIKDGVQIYFENNDNDINTVKAKYILFAKQFGLNVSHLSQKQSEALMSALQTSELYKRSDKKRKTS